MSKWADRLIEAGVVFVFMAIFMFLGGWLLSHIPGKSSFTCVINDTGSKPEEK